MDRLTERLKEKKPKEEEMEGDPNKKAGIMAMHAEGDEINYIRCESCSERLPPSSLKEKNGLYYCETCFGKLDEGE